MDSTFVTTNPDGSADSWRSTDIDLGAIWYWDRGGILQDAYTLWTRQGPPARDTSFRPALNRVIVQRPAGDAALTGLSLFQVDAAPDNPFDYRLITPANPGQSMTLRKIEPPLLRTALMADLNFCKNASRASYQRITQTLSGETEEYIRLLLPTVGRDGTVTCIHGLTRPVTAAMTQTNETSYEPGRTPADNV
jgi:hypothetical protein